MLDVVGAHGRGGDTDLWVGAALGREASYARVDVGVVSLVDVEVGLTIIKVILAFVWDGLDLPPVDSRCPCGRLHINS